MEHLTDFVFISMGNLTLACRDAYLTGVKNDIKLDTLTALRRASLQIANLFLDSVIKRAEENIAHYDNKEQSASSSSCSKGRYHLYERSDKRSDSRSDIRLDKPAWKNSGRKQFRKGKGKSSSYSSRPNKGQQSYK